MTKSGSTKPSTPYSSRFWPAAHYKKPLAVRQALFDKQNLFATYSRLGELQFPKHPARPVLWVSFLRFVEATRANTGKPISLVGHELDSQAGPSHESLSSGALSSRERHQLEGLVNQMVERGILFDEAVGEFEKFHHQARPWPTTAISPAPAGILAFTTDRLIRRSMSTSSTPTAPPLFTDNPLSHPRRKPLPR